MSRQHSPPVGWRIAIRGALLVGGARRVAPGDVLRACRLDAPSQTVPLAMQLHLEAGNRTGFAILSAEPGSDHRQFRDMEVPEAGVWARQSSEGCRLMRVAIAGFQHETNTFAGPRATFADFEMADSWPGLLRGEDVIEGTRGINLPIAGIAGAAAKRADVEIVPILWANAEPCAYVTDDAFDRIAGEVCSRLADAGPLDGICLDLHGAMVTESHTDGEGEFLARIRRVVGPDMPITASLDLHANLTRRMVETASALAIFRSYPHLDMAATGARAFELLERLMAGEPLAKAYAPAPYLIPLTQQHTGSAPCDRLYERLERPLASGAVSADIAMGFPAADIPEMGPAVLAYGETAASAEAAVAALLEAFADAEPAFEDPMMPAAEAVSLAIAAAGSGAGSGAGAAKGPVVIADAQDNPGAGASSDSTGLLRALVDGGARGAALALLNDPAAASEAVRLGPGAVLEAALGGRSGVAGDAPFRAHFRVLAVSEGRFAFTGEMNAGAAAEIGLTARLQVLSQQSDVQVLVGSRRCQCLDQAVFTHLGFDPRAARILGVKSTVHFRADFEPIASDVLVAEAPGATPCRPDRVVYRRLRRGVRLTPMGRVR